MFLCEKNVFQLINFFVKIKIIIIFCEETFMITNENKSERNI